MNNVFSKMYTSDHVYANGRQANNSCLFRSKFCARKFVSDQDGLINAWSF